MAITPSPTPIPIPNFVFSPIPLGAACSKVNLRVKIWVTMAIVEVGALSTLLDVRVAIDSVNGTRREL
jgi:hypothetical protein